MKDQWKIIIFDLERDDERLNSRRLRGFKETESENHHALPEKIFTQ
jgi:hypothetical protein